MYKFKLYTPKYKVKEVKKDELNLDVICNEIPFFTFDANVIDKLYEECNKKVSSTLIHNILYKCRDVLDVSYDDKKGYLKEFDDILHLRMLNVYNLIKHMVNNYNIDVNAKEFDKTALFYVKYVEYPDVQEKIIDLFMSKGANINAIANGEYCFSEMISPELFRIFYKYPININEIYQDAIDTDDYDPELIKYSTYRYGKFAFLKNLSGTSEFYINKHNLKRSYTFREYIKFLSNYVNMYDLHEYKYYYSETKLNNFVEIHKIIELSKI